MPCDVCFTACATKWCAACGRMTQCKGCTGFLPGAHKFCTLCGRDVADIDPEVSAELRLATVGGCSYTAAQRDIFIQRIKLDLKFDGRKLTADEAAKILQYIEYPPNDCLAALKWAGGRSEVQKREFRQAFYRTRAFITETLTGVKHGDSRTPSQSIDKAKRHAIAEELRAFMGDGYRVDSARIGSGLCGGTWRELLKQRVLGEEKYPAASSSSTSSSSSSSSSSGTSVGAVALEVVMESMKKKSRSEKQKKEVGAQVTGIALIGPDRP